MRVAIVHDYLTQQGGGERVVLSLLALFPDADLYTSVYDPHGTFPEFKNFRVRTTSLQRFARKGDSRRLLPFYARAFRNLTLEGYDLVLSSSSGFAHGVNVVGGMHVCYCHTPPRFLHQSATYLAEGSGVAKPLQLALAPLLAHLRRADRKAARRPHRYLANSHVTAARIKDTYGRDSVIVSPPVDLDRLATSGPRSAAGSAPVAGAQPYFLAISRLLPYKRVDLAIKAAERTGTRLVVVGEGPALPALQAIAGPDVEFRGRVTDAELNELLEGCEALIQAGAEDFGIVPLEANAAGKPVVAYAAGGALETVVDGVSGVLVPAQDEEAFAAALIRVQRTAWDADAVRGNAQFFGERRFHQQLLAELASLGLPVSDGLPAAVTIPAPA